MLNVCICAFDGRERHINESGGEVCVRERKRGRKAPILLGYLVVCFVLPLEGLSRESLERFLGMKLVLPGMGGAQGFPGCPPVVKGIN